MGALADDANHQGKRHALSRRNLRTKALESHLSDFRTNLHTLERLIRPDQGGAFMKKCDECYYQ